MPVFLVTPGQRHKVLRLGHFHHTGRDADARELFSEMLARRTPAGLLSEDIDPQTGELWGNYPQTYSLVGLINCAVLLSQPWSAFR